MSTTGKRKRQELDLKTCFEVIKYSQENPQDSIRKLAEKFHCGKTQIQIILQKKEEILKAFEANSSSNTKRSRGGKNEEIDDTLVDWFRKARSKNMPITGPMLQEKAMQIAKALDVSPEEFKASNGWLDRFKHRTGLRLNSFLGKQGTCVKKQSMPGRKDFQKSYKDMRQRTSGIWIRLGSFLELCQTGLWQKHLIIVQEGKDQRRD